MKYSLIPYIRKDRVNSKGECPINIRYTFKRKMLNIPVGMVIKPENWDDEDDFPIQNKSYNFKEIVKRIELKKDELETILSEYYFKYGTYPSIDDMKGLINNDVPKSKDLTIVGNLEKYIEHLSKNTNTQPNTIKIFKTTKRHFSDFEIYQKKTYSVYDLNKSVLESFSFFLIQKDLQISSVGKYVKSIKIFLSKYVMEELNLDINQTFRNVKTPTEERDKNDVLTIQELELLKYNVFFSNYQVEEYNRKHKDLKLVKYDLTDREILIGKIFLLLCSTGLSYVDVMKLSINNFYRVNLEEMKRKTNSENSSKSNENNSDYDELEYGILIKIERTKIKKDNLCVIPVFGNTLDVLTSEIFRLNTGVELSGDIYEDIGLDENERIKFFWKNLQKSIRMKDEGTLKRDEIFHPISNPYFNREIKKLFKKIGVNDRITLTKRDRNRTSVVKYKYDLISSHTGRRTYISINLEKGIRPDTLMKTTGHKSYETMLVYIQQKEDNIFKEMYTKIEN